MQQHGADNAIHSYRALTEARLSSLLKDAESPVTLDKVKSLIFEGDGVTDSRAHLTAMLAALKCDVDDIDDATLQVFEDAWNYFPHRVLNGRCPAEVFAELS